MTLLDRYEEWDTTRTAIWEAEEVGFEDSEYTSDDMGWSDDEGVDLLREFQSAYEGLLKAASQVFVNLGQGGSFRNLLQVAMLDTTSSASRQHYIDTGRFLQEGESS